MRPDHKRRSVPVLMPDHSMSTTTSSSPGTFRSSRLSTSCSGLSSTTASVLSGELARQLFMHHGYLLHGCLLNGSLRAVSRYSYYKICQLFLTHHDASLPQASLRATIKRL